MPSSRMDEIINIVRASIAGLSIRDIIETEVHPAAQCEAIAHSQPRVDISRDAIMVIEFDKVTIHTF